MSLSKCLRCDKFTSNPHKSGECRDCREVGGAMGFPKLERIKNNGILQLVREATCVHCGKPNPDACHIRGVGAGGPDEHWNLIPLCRAAHQEQHTNGWLYMDTKYLSVSAYLSLSGWTFDQYGKIWNPRLRVNE